MVSSIAGSEFFGGSDVSRTGHRAKGEPVFSKSARRASGGEREKKETEKESYSIPDITQNSINVMEVWSDLLLILMRIKDN